MNLTVAPTPATTTPAPIVPTDVNFEWTTKHLGVTRRHEFTVDLSRTPNSAHDSHTTVTTAKGIPIWVSVTAYKSGEINAPHRAAVADALSGSGLLTTPQSPGFADAEPGELQIIVGTEAGGVLPMWSGRLSKLPSEMRQVWDAAQSFMDDAAVERKLGPGDIVDD